MNSTTSGSGEKRHQAERSDRSEVEFLSERVQVLLALGRGELPVEGDDPGRSRIGEGDGDDLLRTAYQHGVLSRVLSACEEADIGPSDLRVDPGAWSHWRSVSERYGLFGLLLLRELRRLSSALRASDLPFAAWKGPVLAEELYGDVTLRPSTDLDLLVPRSRVGAAAEVLAEHGYAPEAGWEALDRRVRRSLGYAAGFYHEDRGVTVELHWAIAPRRVPAPFRTREALDRIEPDSNESALPVLAPPDRLLAHAVHGLRHKWGRLGWIEDFARLADRAPEPPWEAVRRSASDAGLEVAVQTAIRVARLCYRPELPTEIIRWAEPDGEMSGGGADRVSDRVRAVLGGLADPTSPDPETAAYTWEKLTYLAGSLDERSDRWAFWWDLAVRPSERDYEMVPDAAYWALPLVRPLRLALEYGPDLLGRLVRR